MQNRALDIRKYLSNYAILWFFCAGVQWLVLYAHEGISWYVALIDTLTSTVFLFLLSLAIWYVVRFAEPGGGIRVRTLLNAMLAGLFLLALSYYIAQFFLDRVFLSSDAYEGVAENIMLIKLALGGMMVVLINMFFISLHLLSESREAAVREVRLKTMVQQTELQALKNQLNPHFIYNSLNAISSLTTTAPAKAREMIIRLSEFLRYALKTDAMQLNSLSDEIQAIERYLEIEKVRFGDKLQYRFEFEPDQLRYLIPAMILQPLFENAIKHGIQHVHQGGEILCLCSHSEHELTIIVSNPCEAKYGRTPHREGVGLENIRNRLRVLYGNGKLLQVSHDNKLFQARLSLPITTNRNGKDQSSDN